MVDSFKTSHGDIEQNRRGGPAKGNQPRPCRLSRLDPQQPYTEVKGRHSIEPSFPIALIRVDVSGHGRSEGMTCFATFRLLALLALDPAVEIAEHADSAVRQFELEWSVQKALASR